MTEVNYYRTIFILSNFTKIFEKLVVAILTNFLQKQNILHDNQYGFCPKLSTTHPMLDVINGINTNMSKNQFTGLICLDLKKAFDTVSHSILSHKLEHYGMHGNMLDLVTSYLTERKQVCFCKWFLVISKNCKNRSASGIESWPYTFPSIR